ncbi:hypothetical protein Tco_1410944 [Tanacetum coccineum]
MPLSKCKEERSSTKWVNSLLRNKEKRRETPIATVNVECSAIIREQSFRESTKTRKFLSPLALQELDRLNDKDVEIKSSSSFTLTSPEESEFEAYLKKIRSLMN